MEGKEKVGGATPPGKKGPPFVLRSGLMDHDTGERADLYIQSTVRYLYGGNCNYFVRTKLYRWMASSDAGVSMDVVYIFEAKGLLSLQV